MFHKKANPAPNAGKVSRVWRVLVGLGLQTRETCLAFGVCDTTVCRAGRGSERLILQGFWGELGSMRAFPENSLRKIFKILEIGIFYAKRALI